MKRVICVILSLVLCLSLLPVTVLGSNLDDEIVIQVYNYEDLIEALNAASAERIIIFPTGSEMSGGELSVFAWPETETSFNLVSASDAEIWLGNGEWVIPEHITVNNYEEINMGAPTDMKITVDGTWNNMSAWAVLGNVGGFTGTYGEVEVNGTMTLNKQSNEYLHHDLGSAGKFILNGTLHVNVPTYTDETLILGPNAVITGNETFTVEGSIIGPSSGRAMIQNLNFRNNEKDDPHTVTGSLQVETLSMVEGSLIFGQGSDIIVTDKLSLNSAYNDRFMSVAINGKMSVSNKPGYPHSLKNVNMTIGSGGELRLRPNCKFGNASSNSTIQGSGLLRLYAGVIYDSFADHPEVFDVNTRDAIPNEVTVNIWRNWSDSCDHVWGQPVETLPTCGQDGYLTKICTLCEGEEVTPSGKSKTGLHNMFYNAYSDNLYQRCLNDDCGHSVSVYLVAENAKYDGNEQKTASLINIESWEGDLPITVSYQNNVEKGVATVTATCGTYSCSVTFLIDDCAHWGGRATCQEKAICNDCEKPYGEFADHRWTGDYEINSTSHWYACRTPGCTARSGEGLHEFPDSEEMIEAGYPVHICMACYYGDGYDYVSKIDTKTETVTVEAAYRAGAGDTVFAAVYDSNGKFLGCDAETLEEIGYAVLEVTTDLTADKLKVFFAGENMAPGNSVIDRELEIQN